MHMKANNQISLSLFSVSAILNLTLGAKRVREVYSTGALLEFLDIRPTIDKRSNPWQLDGGPQTGSVRTVPQKWRPENKNIQGQAPGSPAADRMD